MSANLKKMHEDVDRFTGGYSQGYLSTWCSYVHEEWTEFLDRAFNMIIPQICSSQSSNRSAVEAITKDTSEPRVLLDVGCGPSISNIISASKWTSNIILADFLESNRREVERFWKLRTKRAPTKHSVGITTFDLLAY